jgi:RecT family protein
MSEKAQVQVVEEESFYDDPEVCETQTDIVSSGGGPAIAYLGKRQEIREVQKRILHMIPGAADAPLSVQLAAAQLVVAHGLNPFNGELYIMPTGRRKVTVNGHDTWEDVYVPYIGVKGLRRIARRQSMYLTDFREMDTEEVNHHRRGDYDPDDVGVTCTLARLDLASLCQSIKMDFSPSVGYGFWRKKARKRTRNNQVTWYADNIPETWTPLMVAEKRAEVNAIKQVYDMDFHEGIKIEDPAMSLTGDNDTAWSVLEDRLGAYEEEENPQLAEKKWFEEHAALPAESSLNREGNGDVLYA